MPTTRSSGKFVNALKIGSEPANFKSGIKPATKAQLEELVSHIKVGMNSVSLPVPPYKHAFLINVTKDKIMVCDWGGVQNFKKGESQKQTKISGGENRWIEYSEFLRLLEKKLGIPIEYYEVDKKIFKDCMTFHYDSAKAGGEGGGCSEYIVRWLAKYQDEI
jgi:hypothetical protein